ncbi:hypothetical protein PHYBLDRAFT_176312 [Phycomyces blakesleeanus NRRL 1555(-)]|uniref:Uncharacterized protein n=1 Tax=Phycomyces blakesleeanus (strain ATCC 8743b / DSM 1359 / FGSC 10004 / NBRC 33097 / NRRL 1555) TaxID=763407 RepID=A0A162T9L6_PHYB8|nr:hypothetical protein PHYBLDRAFT_176312 [Phycomyces blakesleeanus NRRL 1555(-)]OAD65273.1 hypothetical protein PHYBLDRAFT_176312 [Phycomyces blakesleeanus NRRL 1555(-)]|eukprot:XP_018283313.1 hypothetical protein PHYBLDRAFT_176312 [Phycomyces blakesleeanus NRRL 1555(-)]
MALIASIALLFLCSAATFPTSLLPPHRANTSLLSALLPSNLRLQPPVVQHFPLAFLSLEIVSLSSLLARRNQCLVAESVIHSIVMFIPQVRRIAKKHSCGSTAWRTQQEKALQSKRNHLMRKFTIENIRNT